MPLETILNKPVGDNSLVTKIQNPGFFKRKIKKIIYFILFLKNLSLSLILYSSACYHLLKKGVI